jgi:hypothetical protein
MAKLLSRAVKLIKCNIISDLASLPLTSDYVMYYTITMAIPVKTPRSKFIVDSRDASRDVWVLTEEAKAAYSRGEIAMTDGGYCSTGPNNSYPPLSLGWSRTR